MIRSGFRLPVRATVRLSKLVMAAPKGKRNGKKNDRDHGKRDSSGGSDPKANKQGVHGQERTSE